MNLNDNQTNTYSEHQMPIEELCKLYKTDAVNGLTPEEAKKRLAKFGLNILRPPKKMPEIVRFLKTLFHGFSSLLWFGFVLALVVFFFHGWQSKPVVYDELGLAVCLLCVVIISGIFSFYQEGKSDKVMQSFMSLLPDEAQVIRGGRSSRNLAQNLVPGDLLVIESGDRIAADVRIIESHSLKTDHSALTGECEHLERTDKPTHREALQTGNLAFFGTYAVEGSGKGIVIRTGENTMMGSIARLTSDIKPPPSMFAREISRFICYLASFACFIGVSISALMMAIGYKWSEALIFFVGIIIANVPEGLLPTLTLSLTLASKRMAARNCLVKKLDIVESLGTASVVCSDKTGTLTQNRMTIAHLMFNKRIYSVKFVRNVKSVTCFKALARCASLCSRAEFAPSTGKHISVSKRKVTGDASEAAILKCPQIATELEILQFKRHYPKIFEKPFNSTDKRQISVHEAIDKKYLLVMKGAPEKITEACSVMLTEEGEVPITESLKAKIFYGCGLLAGSGERVLAFCDLENFNFDEENFQLPEKGLRFLGLVSMIDPPRPNVPEAVLECREAGIKVIMVTGDHPLTALSIAKQVHIISDYSEVKLSAEPSEPEKLKPNAIVLKGDELETLSPDALDAVLQGYEEIVFARTSPRQKMRIVESCQRLGWVVAVTGDGVNDAPALKKADIGIAMGIAGSAVAKQSAKLILLDDNFATLVRGIEEGRLVFENLKKSIGYTLTHLGPEVLPLLLHIIGGFPLPLSVIAMLFIDVGTDMLPSIALAYEPPERDLMKHRPRNIKTDRLVSASLLFQVLKMSFIESLALLFAYFIVMAEDGWFVGDLFGSLTNWKDAGKYMNNSYGVPRSPEERKILERTCYSAAFAAIVVSQAFNALVFKTSASSNLSGKAFNPCLLVSIVFSFALAFFVIYIPGLSGFLQMQPLKAAWWTPALPFAAVVMIYDELRKKLVRRNPKGWLARNTTP